MNRKLLAFCVGTGLAGLACQSLAAPFVTFDPRSMAMGGAGVAVTDFNHAPMFNPALMAHASESDDFNLALPIFGARLYDQDDLIDVVEDDAVDTINGLEAAQVAVENGFTTVVLPNGLGTVSLPSSAQLLTARDAADSINDLLQKIDSRAINIEAGGAAVAGIPSRKFGIAVSLIGWSAAGGIGDYSDSDQNLLTSLAQDAAIAAANIDELQAAIDAQAVPAGGFAFNPLAPCDQLTTPNFNDDCSFQFTEDEITSAVRITGVAVAELGLTIARDFKLGTSSLAVGITPKMVRVSTFDFRGDVNTGDLSDFDESTKESTNFNLDIGVAHGYANGFQVGLVVKNLLTQEYEAPAQNNAEPFKVKLEPQTRAGVSYQNSWFLAALDLDLTENNGVGFGADSQYLSFGVELDAFDWAQIRLGLREDIANDAKDTAYSVGFGLSPFGTLHFDFALTADDFSDPNEVGAALQLAFTF